MRIGEIKLKNGFNLIKKNAWLFAMLVAVGGMVEPKLGLLAIMIMVGLNVTAFFMGKFWCGNFCPHGSFFDNLIKPFSYNKRIPAFFKSKIFIISFFMFFMYNFTRKILKVSKFWGTYDFYDKLGFVFVTTYLMVLAVGGILALFIAPRTWCRFCPMGTMQKFSYKMGKVFGIADKTEKKITIVDPDECIKCGKCSKVCPVQLTPYLEFNGDNQFCNIDCIKCSTCVENCPKKLLSLERNN